MNIIQNKWFLRFATLVFGVTLFLIFFYLTFPFDLMQKKIVLAFEKETGCKTASKEQAVHALLRLHWRDVRVVCPNIAPVALDLVEAKIALLPALLRQRGDVDFKIKIANKGGELSGTLIADPTPQGIAFSLKKEGVGVGVHVNYRGFSGILDTRGFGNWIGQDIVLGKGVFNFNLKDVHFKTQTLPLDIRFRTVTGKLSWETGAFSIGHVSAEGDIASLTSHGGSLILHEPFSESFISMTLNVLPKGQLKQVAELMISGYKASEPLKIEVTGPLTKPKVLLNGRLLPTGS